MTSVDELLAADRAFSAASARTDLISGLSAMFAGDVAMPVPSARFSTSATEAVAALSANPDNARSRIEWVPVRGGIAADGQHGYTWGYMTLTRPDGTMLPLKYLSYWLKQPEGWRVFAYKRRPRPAGDVALAPVAPSLPARLVAPSADAVAIERFRASLDQTERAFSAEAQVVGLGVAFARYGSADAVNIRAIVESHSDALPPAFLLRENSSLLLHHIGVMWCIKMHGSPLMAGRSKSTQGRKAKRSTAPRASVTFPPDVYRTLEEIAKQKKVSVAWVVRDAAEEYVKAQWPLLAAPGEKL